MELKSVFENNGKIPEKYTCDGENINPELRILDSPEGAKSFALIMDDPDISNEVKEKMGIEVFDHWIIFNISSEVSEIKEGDNPGILGANSKGENKYTGPCPPKEYEPKEHRYFFKLYVLDTELNLEEGATKKEVENAMEGHVIEKAELVGRYERK